MERAKRIAQDELDSQMKEVSKGIKSLSTNLNQVRNLAKKDPEDHFDQVMSVFYEQADKQYQVCSTLKGTRTILFTVVALPLVATTSTDLNNVTVRYTRFRIHSSG